MKMVRRILSVLSLLFIGISIVCILNEVDFPNYSIAQKKREIVFYIDKDNEIEQSFLNFNSEISTLTIYPVVIDQEVYDSSPLVISFKKNNEVIYEETYSLEKNNVLANLVQIEIPKSVRGNPFSIIISSNASPRSLGIWGSVNDSYPNGSFYLNKKPYFTDISFITGEHLSLNYFQVCFKNSLEIIPEWVKVFIISLFLFSIITVFLFSISKMIRITRGFLNLFLAIAFIPILIYLCGLAADLINVHLNKAAYYVIFLLFLYDLIFVFFYRKHIHKKIRSIKINDLLIGIAFVIIFCLLEGIQLFSIEVMPWKDGLFHQQLIQKMIQDQKIPFFYPYQIGFHLITLLISQLSNDPSSILICGQMTYFLFFLSCFLLGRKIFNNNVLGLLTSVLIAFYSPFGTLLLSWGKYPLLLGFSLLNALVSVLIDDSLEQERKRFPVLMILAGLFLIHWKISILALLILCIYMTTNTGTLNLKAGNRGIALLIILLFSFVIYDVASLLSNSGVDVLIESIIQYGDPYKSGELFLLSLEKGGFLIWLFGLAGFIHFIVVNAKQGSWYFGFVLISIIVPFVIYALFPFSFIGKLNIMIFLQIIFCCFFVYEIKYLFLNFGNKMEIGKKMVSCFVIAAGILGGVINLQPIRSINILCDKNDMNAFKWIKSSLKEGSKFLISSEEWNGKQFPTDGGGWLSSFTNNYAVYSGSISDELDSCDYFIKNQIEYIYLGSGNTQRYIYQAIEDEIVIPVYYSNGITIYQVECD